MQNKNHQTEHAQARGNMDMFLFPPCSLAIDVQIMCAQEVCVTVYIPYLREG